ncbi:MAG: Lrp/AsnC family transcriptional regulator [Dehalococcoidia bacterium]|nr:Lrp/AsnC family transcriptional regulator [Dehalococcoidia bacterium]
MRKSGKKRAELDEKLIQLLQKNGRQSSQSLARQLKVSPSTILRHIRQLIERKVMRIVGVVDPDKVGLLLAAMIGLDVEPGKLTTVINALVRHPDVKFVSPATGRFDVLLFALFRSNDELSRFVEKELAAIDGVKDSETFICLNVKKGRFAQYAPVGGTLEERLIELLQKDGRQSSESLARQLGVSPSTALRRVRELIRSGVLRIVAVVDLGKVGFPLVVVVGIDANQGNVTAVAEALAQKSPVKFVSTAAGRFDVLAFMRFRSNEEFYNFMEKELALMEGVKDTETFVCLDVKKGRYTQVD